MTEDKLTQDCPAMATVFCTRTSEDGLDQVPALLTKGVQVIYSGIPIFESSIFRTSHFVEPINIPVGGTKNRNSIEYRFIVLNVKVVCH